MKSRLFIIPLLLMLVLSGCLRNQMTLTFDLAPNVNTPCRIVYYASAKKGGMLKESYAQITNGKGEMKLPQGYPAIMFLFSSSSNNPSAIIYAERGDKITVTGNGSDISSWNIGGNKVTEALTEWRLKNKGVLAGNNEEKLNAAVAEYVKKNPDSDAAAILLYVYFQRRGHEIEFANLFALLGKGVRNDKDLMNALSAADLLTGMVEATKVPSEIILTGSEGYADTLKIGKGTSAMLMFTGGRTDSQDKISTDSLKNFLAKRNGKTVAELYSETDSLSWRRHLENDSVTGLRRLWMPLGIADSIAINLGVKRIPYYIILDSKGKEIYRGDNFKEASSKFETLNP